MDQTEESNRYIPNDVWERLRQQQARFMIEGRRNQVLEQREHESRISGRDQEEEEKDEISTLHNDDKSTISKKKEETKTNVVDNEFEKLLEDEDWVIEGMQKLIEEENRIKLMKEAKTSAVKYKRQTDDNVNRDFTSTGYPFFLTYIREISQDPNSPWSKRMCQTAQMLLEMEHDRRREPNIRDLITSVLRKKRANGQEYRVGHWAEILAPNMSWTLEKISKVHHIDDEFLYNVGSRRRLSTYEMRVPEEGLRKIYGYRPWIWQQWAFVKLEQKLRFQENHHDDFEVFQIPEYARNLWFEWLGDPENKDFVAHMSDGRINACQDDLFDHIMKPFYILDDMRRESGWDFVGCDEVSVFTYASLLGTGYVFCFITLILQFTIPILIVYITLEEADYYESSGTDILRLLTAMFCVTDDASFCDGLILTTYIVLCIQLLYLMKVIPDMSCIFSDVAGVGGYGEEKTYAKVKSIREEVRNDNNDRLGQLVGSIMDMYMNTLYVYILFAINLYNILNLASPTEVILNALALEFVFKIDEKYATADWWDPSRRWFKAGTMEVFIQSQFESRVLTSPRLFSDKYGMDVWEVQAICDGSNRLLYDVATSLEDRKNLSYMNHTELFEHYCKVQASDMGDPNFDEFNKPSMTFGGPEFFISKILALMKDFSFWSILKHMVGVGNGSSIPHEGFGVFYRMQYFQTWSRWRRVLFRASIPNIEDLFEKTKYGQSIVKKDLELQKCTYDGEAFANFQKKVHDPAREFEKKRKKVLSFSKMRENFRFSVYQGDYDRALGWVVDGILEWLTYVVQYGFPLYNLFLFGFAFYCIREEINGYLRSVEGIYRCDCRVSGVDSSTFVCEQAFTLNVYSYNQTVNLTMAGLPFDCDVSNEPLLNADFDVDLATSYTEELIGEIYSREFNLSTEEALLRFAYDRKYYCQNTRNWIGETDYRAML